MVENTNFHDKSYFVTEEIESFYSKLYIDDILF